MYPVGTKFTHSTWPGYVWVREPDACRLYKNGVNTGGLVKVDYDWDVENWIVEHQKENLFDKLYKRLKE